MLVVFFLSLPSASCCFSSSAARTGRGTLICRAREINFPCRLNESKTAWPMACLHSPARGQLINYTHFSPVQAPHDPTSAIHHSPHSLTRQKRQRATKPFLAIIFCPSRPELMENCQFFILWLRSRRIKSCLCLVWWNLSSFSGDFTPVFTCQIKTIACVFSDHQFDSINSWDLKNCMFSFCIANHNVLYFAFMIPSNKILWSSAIKSIIMVKIKTLLIFEL